MKERSKCSFCDAAVSHIGEKEGWGRFKGQCGKKKVNIIHCPAHTSKYIAEIQKTLKGIKQPNK